LPLKFPRYQQLGTWNLSLKKTLHARKQEREDVQAARHNWIDSQPTLDVTKLVFLGE
jgi:hypothetical protein